MRDTCVTHTGMAYRAISNNRKPKNRNSDIVVFSDADWATNRVDRKSMSGAILYVNGHPLNWVSKRQTTVALSSCESEIYAMSVAAADALHVWGLLSKFCTPSLPIPLYVDNRVPRQLLKQVRTVFEANGMTSGCFS